jgi:HEAT repeat protein
MTDPAPSSVLPLFAEPADAMEFAKRIIGGTAKVNQRDFAAIAKDKAHPKWTRVAAIYALGLIGARRQAPSLRRIVGDHGDDPFVRAHAAEALGNIGDRRAPDLLISILATHPPPELRESCEYALRELAADR